MDRLHSRNVDNAYIHIFVEVSSLTRISVFLSFLANASLIFHSAKTANRKEVSGADFFALSAYSFRTAVADQKDAYTILCLPDGVPNSQSTVAAAGHAKQSGDSKSEARVGRKYLLWELSH